MLELSVMNDFDLIAIGDIVTDAFIRLKEAEVHCDVNRENCTISLPFAEKIPYEDVFIVPAVGNSPNAAVAASRLGLKSAIATNIGDDENGQHCLDKLKKEGVATDFVLVQEGKKSNYHYILWYADDRTILIKHEKFDYKLGNLDTPKWVYLSSLGENSLDFHKEIAGWLKTKPEIKLAFQPGTYQMNFGKEKLKDIYERTNIFFSNVEEAERILEIDTLGIQELLVRIRALGPKIVVITDGPKGAYVYDGGKTLFVTPYPDPKPPFERTGAGDALSSTVVSALALGNDLETALKWGAINSMSVVQKIGAQEGLLSREEIEKYLASAPAEFVVKEA